MSAASQNTTSQPPTTLSDERLALISTGTVVAKIDEVDAMVEVITDRTAPLYFRGLAVASLGSFLRSEAAPSTVNPKLHKAFGRAAGKRPLDAF